MSHGIYAVENEKVNCPAGAREAALGHTQLARTTLMRGQMIEPRADEDIRPYGDAANE